MMRIRQLLMAGALIGGLGLGACTPPGGGGGGTTTTTPADVGHVAGLTENQVCAGPVSPAGCTTAFNPASDTVTISSATVLDLKLQAASNGVFTVDLPSGAYFFQASTTIAGGGVSCPVVPVSVVAGQTIAVTLQCTIELP